VGRDAAAAAAAAFLPQNKMASMITSPANIWSYVIRQDTHMLQGSGLCE